jgi:hypothetical protein
MPYHRHAVKEQGGYRSSKLTDQDRAETLRFSRNQKAFRNPNVGFNQGARAPMREDPLRIICDARSDPCPAPQDRTRGKRIRVGERRVGDDL